MSPVVTVCVGDWVCVLDCVCDAVMPWVAVRVWLGESVNDCVDVGVFD